jgi:hypothetical protein
MTVSCPKIAIESHIVGLDADFAVAENQVIISIRDRTLLHPFVYLHLSEIEQESFLPRAFGTELFVSETAKYAAIFESGHQENVGEVVEVLVEIGLTILARTKQHFCIFGLHLYQ